LEAMQNAHLGNLKRLFGLGKLIGAGPVQDPTGFRRGIAVLTVPDKTALEECFKPDPYVQGKIMTIQAWPWKADRKGLGTELPDPNAIEENRLVSFKAKKEGEPPAAALGAHARVLKSLGASIFGRLEDPQYQEIALLQGPEQATIQSFLDADPLMTQGWASYEIIPLWMAKGALKTRP